MKNFFNAIWVALGWAMEGLAAGADSGIHAKAHEEGSMFEEWYGRA